MAPSSYTTDETRATKLVLPIPGSPATRKLRCTPSPSMCFHASSNWSTSAVRPTNASARAEARRAGKRWALVDRLRGQPDNTTRGDGYVKTFQVQFAHGRKDEAAPGPSQLTDDFGGEDLAALGHRTEARGLDNGNAEIVPIFYIGVPQRHTDPNHERFFGAAVPDFARLLKGYSAGGPFCGAWGDDHEPIA